MSDKRKTMMLSAAALLMFLTGCESLPGPMSLAVNEPGFDISKIETQRTITPSCSIGEK
jgi:hypothetical protein